MTRGRSVAALLVLLGESGRAGADGVSLGLEPAAVGDRASTVRSADVRGDGRLRASMLAEYAHDPLRLTTADQSLQHVVSDQLRVHGLLSLALDHRWLFALDLPLTLVEEGQAVAFGPSPTAPARGDLALLGRAKLLGPAGDGTHFSVQLDLWLPTGTPDSYSSDEATRIGGRAIVGGVNDRFAWSAESGFATRPSHSLPGVLPVRLGNTWSAGVGAIWIFDAKRSVALGPELTLRSVVGGGAKLLDPLSTQAHLLLGGELRPAAGPWFVRLAGGPGLGDSPGAAAYRLLASVGWAREGQAPAPDRDRDGVADQLDACADLAGERSSDPLMNGCPELPDDLDGDAIFDRHDACPRVAGEATGDRRTHGCPVQPLAPKPAPEPPPEPPPPPAQLEQERIVISDQVQFETGTARLLPESDRVLGAVAQLMTAHPELELVEVQGHTDDTGSPELNRNLASDRARAVVTWLTQHGISSERLIAASYGQERPIADNTTEAGRAKNRRVEFHVIKRASAGEPP